MSRSSEIPKRKRRWLLWAGIIFIVVILLGLEQPVSHIDYRGYLSKTKANTELVIKCIKLYAAAHNGSFPNELGELRAFEKTKVLQPGDLDEILASMWTPNDARKPLDWLYVAGGTTTSPTDRPVMISPLLVDKRWAITRGFRRYFFHEWLILPPNPTRVVGTADGSVLVMSEEALQDLARKYHLKLRDQRPPEGR